MVGGDCVYLEKGETLRYANGGTPEQPNVESAELKFIYMNAGYTGYYQYDTLEKSDAANDGAITMTAFKITEDAVEVYRYDENGRYPLARVPYHTTVPSDDEILGYTGLPTLDEAGGSLDDVKTVQTKIGEDGALIILNKTIEGAQTLPVGWLAGIGIAVVIAAGVGLVVKKHKKATGK